MPEIQLPQEQTQNFKFNRPGGSLEGKPVQGLDGKWYNQFGEKIEAPEAETDRARSWRTGRRFADRERTRDAGGASGARAGTQARGQVRGRSREAADGRAAREASGSWASRAHCCRREAGLRRGPLVGAVKRRSQETGS